MPVSEAYAEQMLRENSPVVGGRQYRAQEVVKGAHPCNGCDAEALWDKYKNLCNKMPPCVGEDRLDGRDVVFVDVGPAPEPNAVAHRSAGANTTEKDEL